MKKPPSRKEIRPRRTFNTKRRLSEAPDRVELARIARGIRYEGSPKHKRNPDVFGLEPYRGGRSDRTMCDRDAGFAVTDMRRIGDLFVRGGRAGLVDIDRGYWWTIADSGWVFEATADASGDIWHGYPLVPGDPMVETVLSRFAVWAASREARDADRLAAENCRKVYGLRP